MATKLTRVEAEQVARFVTENHDKIVHGMVIDRAPNGRLRLRPADMAPAHLSKAANSLGIDPKLVRRMRQPDLRDWVYTRASKEVGGMVELGYDRDHAVAVVAERHGLSEAELGKAT